MKFQKSDRRFPKHIVQLEKLSSVELQDISSRPAAREHQSYTLNSRKFPENLDLTLSQTED